MLFPQKNKARLVIIGTPFHKGNLYDPLIKAGTKGGKSVLNLGTWQGMKIIAIGPKGGKIVGYNSKGEPIYAGSKTALSLAATKVVAKEPMTPTHQDKLLVQWLLDLGIKGKIGVGYVLVSDEAADLLAESFGVKAAGTATPGEATVGIKGLMKFLGEPLTPKLEDESTWAAEIASGQHEDHSFPDLADLKEIPAGKYKGSHGNRLFKDKTGKLWIFKYADATIARAEEAATRLGRLILGPVVPPVKYVQIDGKDGALIGELKGTELNAKNHSHPPVDVMKKIAKQIVKHQVVDWLTSNHDGHAGNFLVSGNTLHGIDKGQAWKWFGKDNLDPAYHGENPSYTIYHEFWKAVASGAIPKEGLVQAMAEAIAEAEKITEAQFGQIVAPYCETHAAWKGGNAKVLAKKMWLRLQNLRSDFNYFLAYNGFGQKALPAAGEKAKPAMTIKAPGKPTVIPGTPKAGEWKTFADLPEAPSGPFIMAEATGEYGALSVTIGGQAPGWPIKKGTVSVAKPGDPPLTTGKWPKGIPGPGYQANITYKGKSYGMQIESPYKSGKLQGKPIFVVFYPNGTHMKFTSANMAGDSLKLFDKGLPMGMTGTEKKEHGISLGSKVFKFKEFEKELSSAHSGGELSPNEMTPKQLEKEKLVMVDGLYAPLGELLKKEPNGIITDWGMLPQAVKEFLEANNPAIGPDWELAIVPGFAVKTAASDGTPLLWVAFVNAEGKPEYKVWGYNPASGWSPAPIVYPAFADKDWNFGTMPDVQSAKKYALEVAAEAVKVMGTMKAAMEQTIGSPPEAVLPEEAFVPENAPKHHEGPLAPGTLISVGKKFAWDKGKKKKDWTHVELAADYIGDVVKFTVYYEDAEGVGHNGVFSTLSAASDWVWLRMKGYDNADEYKKAKKTNKIPSGGGWKFWKIDPKAAAAKPEILPPVPSPLPPVPPGDAPVFAPFTPTTAKVVLPPALAPTPSEPNWEAMPESPGVDALKEDPVGTKYKVITSTGYESVLTKTAKDQWHLTDEPVDVVNSDENIAAYLAENIAEAGYTLQKLPAPGEPNWETMPDDVPKTVTTVAIMGVGTKLKVTGGMYHGEVFEKDGVNSWVGLSGIVAGMVDLNNTGVANALKNATEILVQTPVPVVEPIPEPPPKWAKMPKTAQVPKVLADLPTGAKVMIEHQDEAMSIFRKNAKGTWDTTVGKLKGMLFYEYQLVNAMGLAQNVYWEPVPTEAPVAAEKPWKTVMFDQLTASDIGKMEVGQEIKWSEGNETYTLNVSIVPGGKVYWIQDKFDKVGSPIKSPSAALKLIKPDEGSLVQATPGFKVDPVVPEKWKVFPPNVVPVLADLKAEPIGVSYKFVDAVNNIKVTYKKTGHDEWESVEDKVPFDTAGVHYNLEYAVKQHPAGAVSKADAPAPSEVKWSPMAGGKEIIKKQLDAAMIGNKVRVVHSSGGIIEYTKFALTGWKRAGTGPGSQATSEYLADILDTAMLSSTVDANWPLVWDPDPELTFTLTPQDAQSPEGMKGIKTILEAESAGAKYKYESPSGDITVVTKNATGSWDYKLSGDDQEYNAASSGLAEGIKNGATMTKLKLSHVTAPGAENWETMPPTDLDQLKALPVGTKIRFENKDGSVREVYTKVSLIYWNDVEGKTYPPAEVAGEFEASWTAKQLLPTGAAPTKDPVPDVAMLDKMPTGSVITYDAPLSPPNAKPLVIDKLESGAWRINASQSEAASEEIAITLANPKTVIHSITVKKAPVQKSIANLPKQMVTSFGTLPLPVIEKIEYVHQSLPEWLKPEHGGHAKGEKAPGWPPWCPPAGVIFEGEFDGKKYWFLTGKAGYEEDGTVPSHYYQCAIIDEDGKAHSGGHVSEKKAGGALKKAAQLAGLDLGIPALKKLFGLNKAKFAAGETYTTVTEGTGTSALPDAPAVHPEDMKAADKPKKVKTNTTLQHAIEHHDLIKAAIESGATLKIKPVTPTGPGGGKIQVGDHAGEQAWTVCLDGAFAGAATLYQVASQFGITDKIHNEDNYPKTNGSGAFMTLPESVIQKIVAAEMSALDALSLPPAVSEDNWETMPEGVPQVIYGGAHKKITEKYIAAMPLGTVFGSDTYGYFKKKQNNQIILAFTMDGVLKESATSTSYSLVHAAELITQLSGHISLKVMPPEVVTGIPGKKKAKKKVLTTGEQKALAEKKAALVAAQKKAKEVADWAQKHPPVSDAEALHVLAHYQDLTDLYGMSPGGYARVDGKHILLGHKTDPDGFQKIMEDLKAKVKITWVETPLGSMARLKIGDLKKALPAAGTVKGPDGKTYPAGTEFVSLEKKHSVKELLTKEPGFHKFKPHKAAPEKLSVLKVSGTGDEQVKQMNAMIEKFGIKTEFPKPKITGTGVMHYILNSELQKIHEVETSIVPTVPKQPAPFVQASMPFMSGVENWTEVASQPGELGTLPGMKIGSFGHAILMGKPGVFRDFQVVCRKVKGQDGKVYHEVSGQLCEFDSKKATLSSHSAVTMPSAVSKTIPQSKYPTLNYNEEEGCSDEAGAGTIMAEFGYQGATDQGSEIKVFHTSTTFKDTFTIRVPVGQDIESELAAAFEKMGVDPKKATAKMTEKDIRIYKKFCIVRSMMGAMGWNKALNIGKQVHSEAWLDKQLKEFGAEHLVATATIRKTFDGNISVVMDDGVVFEKAGWTHAFRTDKTLDSLFFQIIQGAGWSSRKHKYLMGSNVGGMSPGSDVSGGGATGMFFRIGETAYAKSQYGVVMHPRVFQRTDWWRYNHDQYGSLVPNDNGDPSNSPKRHETHVGDDNSNEIMFQGGLPLSDVVAFTVPNEDEKKKLLKQCAEHGVTEIDGRPLEAIIMVGGGSLKEKLKEMSEGAA